MRKISLIILSLVLMTACEHHKKEQELRDVDQEAYADDVESGLPTFNPDNIKSYQGQILNLFKIPDPFGGEDEVGMIITTKSGTLPVELGPANYVFGGPVEMAPGKTVEVTGSELYIQGSIFVVAQEITVDGYVLELRDQEGNPKWSAWEVK